MEDKTSPPNNAHKINNNHKVHAFVKKKKKSETYLLINQNKL